MSMEDTPRSSRLHIGIFGRTNSGKSSLLNALTNQEFAVVSDVAGTTTDPVYKTMEIHGIGPVVFIDTAGFDDKSELGKKRIEKTEDAASKTDVALVVFSPEGITGKDADFSEEHAWLSLLQQKKIPTICVLNKCDTLSPSAKQNILSLITAAAHEQPVCVSAKDKTGMDLIKEAVIRKIPADFMERTFTGNLCSEGDSVLLVMPQDIQAPKGRLILPQVQILRELLDKNCLISCCTEKSFSTILKTFYNPPRLIITDSQIFKEIYKEKPKESLITSFSILMAAN